MTVLEAPVWPRYGVGINEHDVHQSSLGAGDEVFIKVYDRGVAKVKIEQRIDFDTLKATLYHPGGDGRPRSSKIVLRQWYGPIRSGMKSAGFCFEEAGGGCGHFFNITAICVIYQRPEWPIDGVGEEREKVELNELHPGDQVFIRDSAGLVSLLTVETQAPSRALGIRDWTPGGPKRIAYLGEDIRIGYICHTYMHPEYASLGGSSTNGPVRAIRFVRIPQQ